MLRTKVAKPTTNWVRAQVAFHTWTIQPCKEPNEKERSKEEGGGDFCN